jgi:DNA-binding transcriptional MerR regulator
MPRTFPGTTIEVLSLEKGCSKRLFDGIFAAGGITLSQVSVMTGLEPYLIQNWVKRGFIASPTKRMYSREQFARIIIINMLRETLQIEKICDLIHVIGGVLDDPSDDMIGDDELYHRYVDMIADMGFEITTKREIREAAHRATEDFTEKLPGSRAKLEKILELMLYAHISAALRRSAEEIFATLQ